jgi:hypothetical protein
MKLNYQLSDLKDETGIPSVLNKSPTTKFSKAYLTATGSLTASHFTCTLLLEIQALAG